MSTQPSSESRVMAVTHHDVERTDATMAPFGVPALWPTPLYRCSCGQEFGGAMPDGSNPPCPRMTAMWEAVAAAGYRVVGRGMHGEERYFIAEQGGDDA